MTKHWFTCKVKYTREDVHGDQKTVTEQHVLDAYNYTEAETRMIYILDQMGARPFEVQQITKSNFSEVIRYDDADLWFKVKIAFVTFDENKGEEKSSNQYYLISATDVRDAYDKVNDFLKKSIQSFVIPAVTYTKIIDVYPLDEEEAGDRTIRERGLVAMGETGDERYDEETGEVLED
jgi:hypothetical protein